MMGLKLGKVVKLVKGAGLLTQSSPLMADLEQFDGHRQQ